MERLFNTLRPALRWVGTHPGSVLLATLLTVGLGAWFGLKLHIDSDLSHLLPPDYPSVQALNELRDEVGAESDAAVVIESPSFEANRRFAEALLPRALDLTNPETGEPFFIRVDYRRDIRFLAHNALYFATPAELDTLTAYLRDELREAKLRANPFYVDLDLPEADDARDATAAELDAMYRDLVRSEYPISPDSTVLVLRFTPSGAQTDIDFIKRAFAALESVVRSLQPRTFHPEMTVGYDGRLKRQWVEVQAITRDVIESFGAGVAVLLAMVMAYFMYKNVQARAGGRLHQRTGRMVLEELVRSPLTALVLALPLLASLAWTFGLVYAAYGRLNLMTSTLGLILFGLGIDFGIHFYARYAEERGNGQSVVDALEQTFVTTGQAIAVVAVTTAAAFFVLMIADFRGFSQFGFTAGLGTLFALLSMLVVLPALLAGLERFRLLHLERHPDVRTEANATAAVWTVPGARLIVVAAVIATIAAGFQLDDVRFEYDFGELEPDYTQFMDAHQAYREVYPSSGKRTPAYVLADRIEAVPAIVDAVQKTAARDTLTPTIRSVESLPQRFPIMPEAQQRKLDRIATVRDLLNDRFLQTVDDPTFDRLRRAAQTRRPLPLDSVPDVLRTRFTTKSGNLGPVVIIYPSVGLSDGRNSMRFADDVGTIRTDDGRTYHAASTSIVASDMLRLMIAEAPTMIALTIALIVLFKFILLRGVRWVGMALLPLVASFMWMFGLMPLIGLAITFYNLVVLPTVLGIGDDSGIHIVHRYQEEGAGGIGRVLRSTGEHITVSALTTMVGFGGLLTSMHPGLRTIGALAVLGIGLTLIAALVVLPAVLQEGERAGMKV